MSTQSRGSEARAQPPFTTAPVMASVRPGCDNSLTDCPAGHAGHAELGTLGAACCMSCMSAANQPSLRTGHPSPFPARRAGQLIGRRTGYRAPIVLVRKQLQHEPGPRTQGTAGDGHRWHECASVLGVVWCGECLRLQSMPSFTTSRAHNRTAHHTPARHTCARSRGDASLAILAALARRLATGRQL